MPFITPEDVGTTTRRHLSAGKRLQVWERSGGVCVVCGERIDGVRERWIVEHIRALELGGEDAPANMAVAHEQCGRVKTQDDHARTARAKRQKIRHIGALLPARTLATTRNQKFKRKIDGRVVLRATDERPGPARHHVSHAAPAAASSTNSTSGCKRGWERVDTAGISSENGSRTELDGSAHMKSAKIRPSSRRSQASCAANDILPVLPQRLAFVFEGSPLLPGEDTKQYEAMQLAFLTDFKPLGVVEAIWIRDILDLTWQAQRYRRWRTHILAATSWNASEQIVPAVLRELGKDENTDVVSTKCDARIIALEWLNRTLPTPYVESDGGKVYDLSSIGIPAQVFFQNLPTIERVESLIITLNRNRDAVLREITNTRVKLSQQLREASDRLIEVGPSVSR